MTPVQADPVLLAALADPSDERALMRPSRPPRLLVPIVAEPVAVDDSGEHLVEKQTDMAAVTLVAPDGARALPVFTSMDAIAAWDASARPVPVTAARAAQAAVSERCDVIVVDVAGRQPLALRPEHGVGAGAAARVAARPRGPAGRRRGRRPCRPARRRGARAVGGGARRGSPACRR